MHVNRFQAFAVLYPAPLYKVEGARLAIQILVGVDVVLGPLLTLVVFKPGKPGLKFDMAIIIAIQLSAFIYGASVIISERPVIVSFAVDRFVVIPAAEAKELEMDKLDTQQVKLNAIGPTYVYAEMPENAAEQGLLFGALEGKPDLERRPEFYRDFHANIERNFPKAINLQERAEKSEEARVEIEKYLESSGKSYDDIAAYPVAGKHHDMVLVVDKQSKMLAGFIDIYPWGR
jgi:hypothetical protein